MSNINIPNNPNSTMNVLRCPCGHQERFRAVLINGLICCKMCNSYQHSKCISELSKMTNYLCPQCQINEMDPFIKTITNILPASLIKFENTDTKNTFNFSVSSEAARIIETYSKTNNSKNSVYVMMRSLKLDSEGYEHHWPLNFTSVINGFFLKSLNLPKFPVRSRSRVDYPLAFFLKNEDHNPLVNFHNLNKDHFYPFAKLVNYKTGNTNTIEIKNEFSKNDNDKFSYAISLDLVEIIKDVDDVIKNVRVINEEKNLSNIFYSLLNLKPNEEFLISEELVTFLDCYTQSKKISIPARSLNCVHMGVFDLKYFLSINRRNKTFDCPLCKKKSCNLYVDGFLKNLLKERSDIDEIRLSYNYEWRVSNKDEKHKPEKQKELEKEKEKEPEPITINKPSQEVISSIMDDDDSIIEIIEEIKPKETTNSNSNKIVSNINYVENIQEIQESTNISPISDTSAKSIKNSINPIKRMGMILHQNKKQDSVIAVNNANDVEMLDSNVISQKNIYNSVNAQKGILQQNNNKKPMQNVSIIPKHYNDNNLITTKVPKIIASKENLESINNNEFDKFYENIMLNGYYTKTFSLLAEKSKVSLNLNENSALIN